MPDILLTALRRTLENTTGIRETMSRDEARQLLDALLDSLHSTPADDLFAAQIKIAALLGGLGARGETIDELAGFVDALRARQTPLPMLEAERKSLVDTCGTGGDLSGTFNISTASALVAAAAGARVAKHGNRAVTSRCGSADVLEALGVPVDLNPAAAAEALRTHRFAFLPAPAHQPAMRAMMPIRRAIGVRTAFNIVGPLTNPAGAKAQVVGVYSEQLVLLVAETLAKLDTRHAFVVHGCDKTSGCGMDELSISGPTTIAEVRGTDVMLSILTPVAVGLQEAPIETLAGGDARENAAILTAIFAGEQGPRRDVVVMNAGAVLVTAELAKTLKQGVALAQQTIDEGKATALVDSLRIPPPSDR